MVNVLRMKDGMLVVFVNERNFFAIESCDIEIHQTFCISLGVYPITVLLSFRIIVIADVKGRFAQTRGRGICSKFRTVVVFIIIKIISISNAVRWGGSTVSISIKMNRVEWILTWICVPRRVVNVRLRRVDVMWWGSNGQWLVTDNVFGINKFS